MNALRLLAVGTLATVALAACGTMEARLPDGFAANAIPYDVRGHSPRWFDEPLHIGPYSALAVRDGGTFSWSIPVGRVDIGRSARHYAFTLAAPHQPPVEVQCRIRTWTASHGDEDHAIEVDLTDLAGPMMTCGLWFEGAPGPLPLELVRKGTRFSGRLIAPWRDYDIRSLHGYAGSNWPAAEPTGFEVLAGDAPAMVVDRLNAGRVHVGTQVDETERAYLAAAAAALLLLNEELAL